MFWKLLLMVLTIGATACTLLVMRQQRLDLLAAQTTIKERIIDNQHALRSLRFELEQKLSEDRLLEWINNNGVEFDAIPFEIRFDEPLQLPVDLALDVNR